MEFQQFRFTLECNTSIAGHQEKFQVDATSWTWSDELSQVYLMQKGTIARTSESRSAVEFLSGLLLADKPNFEAKSIHTYVKNLIVIPNHCSQKYVTVFAKNIENLTIISSQFEVQSMWHLCLQIRIYTTKIIVYRIAKLFLIRIACLHKSLSYWRSSKSKKESLTGQ